MTEPGLTLDPNDVIDLVDRMFLFGDDGSNARPRAGARALRAAECAWRPEVDPVEQEEFRRHQLAYLARYGRQSLLGWENVAVGELDELYRSIGAIVEAENAAGRAEEDRS